MKIPLILMSYNNNVAFRKSLKSLIEKTSNIYELIVVDNKSTDKLHIEYLKDLESNKFIKLYLNDRNMFAYGLSACLKEYDLALNDFFVICDSDFLYPEPINNKCWLQSFVDEMEKNPYIGKLGLSISLSNLEGKEHLKSIVYREKSFSKFSLNENVWIAQVDTTPAIYRKNFFIWNKFRLYPGHMTANKPYYHIGRHKKFIGYHLGWDSEEYQDQNFQFSTSKIDSFALYGGSVDKEVLKKVGLIIRCRYYFLKSFSKLFWIGFKVFMFGLYLLRKKVFFINELLYR